MPRARVLLVDDRPENLLALGAVLAPLGHEIVEARSGTEALNELREGEFAVVLLDMRMPGLDGLQTAAAIRDRTQSRHTPIIFLSADDSPAEVATAYRHGAADFLVKPFDVGALRAKVSVFAELFLRGETLKRQEVLSARLQHERDLLSALIEGSGDGIVFCDPRGVALVFNPAAEHQRGVSRTELLSPWAANFGLMTTDGRTLALEETPLYRAVHGDKITGSWKVRRRDGSLRALTGTASPIRGEDGARVGAVMITRDETDRHHLQEQLLERTHLLELDAEVGTSLAGTAGTREALTACAHALVRHIDAAFARIWTLNEEDSVLELQASAGMYTHIDGPHGRVPVGQFKIGKIAKEKEPHLTNAVVGDPLVGDQGWAAREGMVAFAGYPLLAGDRLVGVMAAFARHPLSETTLAAMKSVASGLAQGIVRRQADETLLLSNALLERSNRELDQFAYVASHDLKAPLRGIANLSEWIEEDVGAALTDKSRQHLTLLRGRVHRMEALIEGILAYARAGRSNEKPTTVRVDLLVKEAIDLLSAPDGVVDVATSMPDVEAERVSFQLVWLNLIGNALKHARRDGAKVTVGSTDAGREWEFYVADNGPGIAAQYHERIFGMFQTLASRDKVEGTGIGLAIAKKVVEARGGRIWVESRPEQGATFRFRWPK